MTCPDWIDLNVFADGEAAPESAASIERHVEQCSQCAADVAALRQERQALADAFAAAGERIPVPRFKRALGFRDVALAGTGGAAIAWVAAAVWGSAVDAVPAGLRWLNPLEAGDLAAAGIDLLLTLLQEGSAMLTATMNLAAVISAVLLVVLLVRSLKRVPGSAVFASLVLAVAILPAKSDAFEYRGGDSASVAAGETIADTLIITGENVAVDGDIDGDLFAFGRRVTIRGNVTGNLFSGAETVIIEGSIGGSVFGGGTVLSLEGGSVTGNVFGGGRDISIDSGVTVGGNVAAFADRVDIDGSIATDLRAYARLVEIRGEVGRNVDAYIESLDVAAPARIGGNLTANTAEADNVRIAAGATIAGTADTRIMEPQPRTLRNRFATGGFYVGQIVRLGAAMVAGTLLLWLFAGLRTVSLPTAIDVLKAGGIGLVAAIMLPVAAVIAGITIVGLPVAVLAVVLWLFGLYLAKIVVAQVIGRRLLAGRAAPPHFALTLLLGLVVVLVAVNLPFIGGLISFVLTCIGLGLLVFYLYRAFEASQRA
ncbi:MAG: hypothetical protein R3305_03750 [Gammaproteobacteria bacterium]|nr:hypothetical protein [Gammaproteobacteria bacterium]